MGTCDELRGILVDAVFGEAGVDDESRLNQHLAECAACRGEEQRLLRLRDEVRDARVEPGPALRARVRAALPAPRGRGALGLLRRPVPAFVAAGASLVAVVAVLLLVRGGGPDLAVLRDRDRASRAPRADVVVPFTSAGSFDTGVVPALSARDSSPRERRGGADSL